MVKVFLKFAGLKTEVKIPEGQQTEIFGGARFVFAAAGKRKTSIIFHAIREPIDLAIRLSVSAEGQVLPRPWCGVGVPLPPSRTRDALLHAQRLIKESPLGDNLVLTELHLPLHRLLDEHRKDEMYGGRSWEDVHAELAERLDAVFAAAAWTVFAFTYRKVEPTRVMIEPVGLETKRALEAFREAVYTQTGLRCTFALREILALPIAVQIYPLAGELVKEQRHKLVAKLDEALREKFGTLEARQPTFLTADDHVHVTPYCASHQPQSDAI